MADLTVTTEVPPSMVFIQEPQCQVPTAHLHLGLDAEEARRLGELADFHLHHHLLEGGAITCPIFSLNPLLRALSHLP